MFLFLPPNPFTPKEMCRFENYVIFLCSSVYCSNDIRKYGVKGVVFGYILMKKYIFYLYKIVKMIRLYFRIHVFRHWVERIFIGGQEKEREMGRGLAQYSTFESATRKLPKLGHIHDCKEELFVFCCICLCVCVWFILMKLKLLNELRITVFYILPLIVFCVFLIKIIIIMLNQWVLIIWNIKRKYFLWLLLSMMSLPLPFFHCFFLLSSNFSKIFFLSLLWQFFLFQTCLGLR